jgi:hypothetical protein
VPRPSSPLNAKASVRSPYALDRSQQNSCVSEEPTHALCYLPDYDVFSGSVLEALGGRTNPSFTMSHQPSQGLAGIRLFPLRSRGDLRSAGWWSQTGSNRRPHACKARALPTELWPLEGVTFGFDTNWRQEMVGPDRLELSTLRLSGVRSNHLSYGPLDGRTWASAAPGARWARDRAQSPETATGEVERETKTATSRTQVECL